MSDDYETTDFSDLRARADAAVKAGFPSRAAAARDAGVAESTFAAFLGATYKGDNAKVAEALETWLARRAAQAQTAASLPVVPGHQLTPTGERMTRVLQYAQVMPDVVAIMGAPGIGKTANARAYRDTNNHVWLVTASPATRSYSGVMTLVGGALGVTERGSAIGPAIGRRLRGLKALIMLDEVQHLSIDALEVLRIVLHDEHRIGLALLGNRAVASRVSGVTEVTAQISSRVGMRMNEARPAAGDVAALLAAWGVSDKRECQELRRIAGCKGALRNLTKTLTLATLLAQGAGAARGLEHIQAAWGQLSEGVGQQDA